MNTTTKVILGIVGAAAAGVAIGMILAPEKGVDTRKNIAKTTGKWVDQVGNIFSRAEEGLADLKRQAKNMKADAEANVTRVKEQMG